MKLAVRGIPTNAVERLRAGGLDANGQPALVAIAEGSRNPCRHCLQLIAEGEEMLVLSYRPFAHAQPYAETGPIFLHRQDCPRYEASQLPVWIAQMTPAIIRGYDRNDWIKYETGAVVSGNELGVESEKILADGTTAYVHIRSRFNCFQCRVERA
jgi:hypothetical protein